MLEQSQVRIANGVEKIEDSGEQAAATNEFDVTKQSDRGEKMCTVTMKNGKGRRDIIRPLLLRLPSQVLEPSVD